MFYRFAADLIIVIHFAFVVFVIFGALLGLRWPRVLWLHLPAAVWGAVIEFQGWICPLTPLENRLRVLGGREGYAGGFIEHYIIPVLYPSGLTHTVQLLFGTLVVGVNILLYWIVLKRWRQVDSSKATTSH